MEILKVEGLTKYFGGLVAVNNLDFSVGKEEIIGLIGLNGSGKTTVLNLITGFHKPNSGRITYRGKDVTRI